MIGEKETRHSDKGANGFGQIRCGIDISPSRLG